MNNKEKWGIVGGGILGMYTAHWLVQEGKDVTLFEASSNIGGLTTAHKLGDVIWDRFYHVILLSDKFVRDLLTELNLEKEIEWTETKTGFYTDDKLYSMSNSIEFLKFPPLSLIDKFRLGFTIFYASKITDWKKLEKIYVEDWLTKLSGKKTFEKIWLPLLKAKLGDSYKKTSAAFIWATIQRMYAARKSGLKKEMFGYVPGGYARIINSFKDLLEKENIDIKTDHVLKSVSAVNQNKVKIEFENGNEEEFDQVILTIPSTLAANICDNLTRKEKEKLNNIQYLGVICPSFLLKKPLSGFYVTNITDTEIPFTGIIEMSALVDKKYFNGNTIVYLPKYLLPDDPAFLISDEKIKEQFFTALQKIYPELTEKDILSFKLAKARNVFALSTINYSENLPSISTSIPGVHIINSAHIVNGTLNVNETIQTAEKALKNILQMKKETAIDQVETTDVLIQ